MINHKPTRKTGTKNKQKPTRFCTLAAILDDAIVKDQLVSVNVKMSFVILGNFEVYKRKNGNLHFSPMKVELADQ